MDKMLLLQAVLAVTLIHGVRSQRYNRVEDACEDRSCYPEIGDLLIGREGRLLTNSTCGLDKPEKYCIVSHLEEIKKCFTCDSRQEYDPQYRTSWMSHRVQNIVSTFRRDWKKRWWQTQNGVEGVYLQLDLEAEFRFTHLIMRFKTFRPRAMFIERSYDFGNSWHIYRYYAYDCEREFPGVPTGPVRDISNVICESRYSDLSPSTEGEVVFRALPPSIDIENPYSQEVQDLIKMTNLRVVFKKLHTLGDDKLGSRKDVNQKYYYSMYDMVVRGSCSCYGHASKCNPMEGQQPRRYMVFGVCECTHNTKGLNCEQCQDFYNDLPWRPALGTEMNACRECNCNGHSNRCHFDAAVYEATGQVSGGVCDDCQHSTQGKNCEECLPHFYQDPRLPPTDANVCKPCNCDPDGSEHGGECESRTDPFNDLEAGRCICKRYIQGPRCDTCQNGFWNKRADNPDGCERCTCNTVGTFGNFGCDKETGQCRCKRFVTGRFCDQCFPNYWGLSNDVDGCKTCDCDPGGSLDNTCDQVTGQCSCRPNIVGRRCDRPQDGYFLPYLDYLVYEGEFAAGEGNVLPVIREPSGIMTWTGPGFMKVTEGDTLTFTTDNIPMSAEYDIVIRYEPQMQERWDDIRVTVIRPEPVDQRGVCANIIPQDDLKALSLPQGSGFYPDDSNTATSENYYNRIAPAVGTDDDYASDSSGDEDIAIEGLPLRGKTTRSRFVDRDGNFVFESSNPDAYPWQGQRHYVINPSTCFEEGVQYQIRFEFVRYRSNQNTPQASILIDSIVLMPSTNSMQMFEGSGKGGELLDEYVRYRCKENQMPVDRPEMADVCRKHVFSISAVMHRAALGCACDQQGSKSGVCDPLGGQCSCRNNIIGRQCDQCAPGTYGFGNDYGCLACNCDPEGSRDNFCDVHNGQCLCVSDRIVGRTCERCSRGYYNFPNCRQCQCNGRADECDDRGWCVQCRDSTGGNYCDRCAPGFYGDPRPGSTFGCRPCFCPGGAGSGFQHANECRLDTLTNYVACECPIGYRGPDCSTCDAGYYGNPDQPSGTCSPCSCNGNIDTRDPGSCDPVNGRCLKCLGNTEGDYCDRCIGGYHGDATRQNCQSCVCNPLGVDRSAGECDRRTGQCPCLPNVRGLECGECEADHWKLASGYGCEMCGCDQRGSSSQQCNEFTGQCNCLPGFGGRDCKQCPDYFYGNPNTPNGCRPCDCNRQGSDQLQCDSTTGQCVCIEGVTGHKCDRCDRGTTGTLPYCVPCGECFDNWDRIIMELKNQSASIIAIGGEIKVGGAHSAFDKEFKEMEDKLEEVKRILDGTGVTQDDLDVITDKLAELRDNLTSSDNQIDTIDTDLEDTSGRIETANNKIAAIKLKVEDVKRAAEELKNNATKIRELDVAGAFNSTKESQRRSRVAQEKVDQAMDTVADSEAIRQQVDDVLDRGQADFDKKYQQNENDLRDVQDGVDDLNEKIVDLNEAVCDGRGDPCDSLCGGAGCGKCGGLSCEDGAVTKASKALDYARRADDALKDRSQEAGNLLDNVRMAQDDANVAKADAQMAFDEAMKAKNISESTRADLQDLISSISDFLTQEKARPADIRAIAEEVLLMSISLTPQQIQDLARQINDTIQGLTDIKQIIDDTREDLNQANALKIRADNAKQAADDILEAAKRVIAALDKAAIEQAGAKTAIDDADSNIAMAEGDLDMIETETEAASSIAQESMDKVGDLQSRLDTLKVQFQQNKDSVKSASDEAMTAQDLATTAAEEADELETKYADASSELDMKYNSTKVVKDRADTLRDRAKALYEDYYSKHEKLKVMETEFVDNEKTLTYLREQIEALNQQILVYFDDIKIVNKFHRTCET